MKLKIALGTLVSLVLLFLAFRNIRWADFRLVLGHLHYGYFLVACVLNILGHAFRSHRWRFMLAPLKRVSFSSAFSATAIGFMANNLLPARAGEFVRAYLIGRSERVGTAGAFATIVYERVVDVFVLLALLGVTLLMVPGPGWLRTGAVSLLALNAFLLVLMILAVRHRGRVQAFLSRTERRFPGRVATAVRRLAASFLEGFQIVRSPGLQAAVAITSLLVWGCAVLRIYFCFRAIAMDVPLFASITMVVFVSLASMIPSAPAYLGTTQYAAILALAVYGVGKSEALAYSLVYHFTQVVPITLVGMFLLWREHTGLREVVRRSSSPPR